MDSEHWSASCNHSRKQTRRFHNTSSATKKKITDKIGSLRIQCLDCGESLKTVRLGQSASNPWKLTEFDYELLHTITQERWGYMATQIQEQREAADEQWWEKYHAHLNSEEWKQIRRHVMDREQSLCQGCRDFTAVNAHHLTYKHLGNEFLFELVALCRQCHDRIHLRESD